MTVVEQSILQGFGLGYSIVALIFVMPAVFILRTYLRFMDHLQLLYLFALTVTISSFNTTGTIFSSYLKVSWVDFPHNIFEYFCVENDFICTAGFQLSFGACLLVFLLLMRIIVSIERCKNGEFRFEPVYTFFKGLTRWVYLPLSYYSILFMILSIQGKADNLISSIVVFCICIIFPVAQLIGYKMIEDEKTYIWRKWLQFFSFARLSLIGQMCAAAVITSDPGPFYAIYGIECLYLIAFGWKNTFTFKILGRIIFTFGQLIMITLFSLFLFAPEFLRDYQIDFFGFSVILLLDICYHIAEIVYFRKHGVPDEEGQKILPEDSVDGHNQDKKKKYLARDSRESLEELSDEIDHNLNKNRYK